MNMSDNIIDDYTEETIGKFGIQYINDRISHKSNTDIYMDANINGDIGYSQYVTNVMRQINGQPIKYDFNRPISNTTIIPICEGFEQQLSVNVSNMTMTETIQYVLSLDKTTIDYDKILKQSLTFIKQQYATCKECDVKLMDELVHKINTGVILDKI